MQKNIWSKLSSDQKLNIIGSTLLVISLFANWFSDKDVFRSGDTFSGLNGPLYLIGYSMLILATGNLLLSLAQAIKFPIIKNISKSNTGKLQMAIGFGTMYLLVLINSVYFHPQFGLNVLSKKSEAGVLLALIASVMICVGGYLAYRQKFIEMEKAAPVVAAREKIENKVEVPVNSVAPTSAKKMPSELTREVENSIANAIPEIQPATVHRSLHTEKEPAVKTDYERSKLYENLKKSMVRDTLSPQERKKLREKETNENVFSAKFANTKKSSDQLVTAEKAKSEAKPNEKKAQPWRMDL